jgi:hypothetical protein
MTFGRMRLWGNHNAHGYAPPPPPPPPINFVKPLKLGAGGWLTRLDIANDGQRLCGTDTYGAYVWDPVALKWSQLAVQSRMPAANFGFFPTTGTQFDHNGGGTEEICACPNSSAIVYWKYFGLVFRSVDHGNTFAKTNFVQTGSNPNGIYRQNGRKMAVDKSNSDHVLVGTDSSGVWETTDGFNFNMLTIPGSTGDRDTFAISAASWNIGSGGVATYTLVGQQQFAITAASWLAGNITYTIPGHVFQPGGVIFIEGMTPSGYNGQFTVSSTTQTTVTVAAAVNPGVATVLGVAVNNDFNGSISITGMLPNGYNGEFPVKSKFGRTVSVAMPVNPGISSTLGVASNMDVCAFPGHNIAFDYSSSFAGGKTQRAYAFSYKNVGGVLSGAVFVTNDGGATWTRTNNGPVTCDDLAVGGDGVVWVCDSTNGAVGSGGILWKYSLGVWAQVTTGSGTNCHSVAVDPVNPSRVVVLQPGGTLEVTTDGGAHWLIASQTIAADPVTDIPWLGTAAGGLYMAIGNVKFDPSKPSVPGTVVCGAGIGVWEASVPTTGIVNWKSKSAGIEQLVSLDGICPNGTFIVAVEDRCMFKCDNPDAYPTFPSTPFKDGFGLTVCWGLDWASSNPNFLVARVNVSFGNAGSNDCYSTDGGDTWHKFTSFYQEITNVQPGVNVLNNGGKVQLVLPTTAGLTSWANGAGSIVRVFGFHGNGANFYCPITVDDGLHVTLLNTAFDQSFGVTGTGGTGIACCVETHCLGDFDGGMTITNAQLGTGGRIKLTFHDAKFSLQEGWYIEVSGVGGCTEANGKWCITNFNGGANTAELFNSTFNPAHTYTSGGIGKVQSAQGGYCAASTPLNFCMVPSNNSYPQMTIDGGLSWTELKTPTLPIDAETGWGFAYYTNRHVVVADRVLANTFYGFNYRQGVYKWTNNGADIALVSGSNTAGANPGTPNGALFPGSSGFNSKLKAVPRNAGHLFFTCGPEGAFGAGHPAGTSVWRSTNGGASWFAIPGIQEPIAIDLGATAPGATYPTLFVVGWFNGDYGVWRSTNADQPAPSFTKVSTYPEGKMDGAGCVVASQTVWNEWAVGMGGSGFSYGMQS